jgi:hypothetical protein
MIKGQFNPSQNWVKEERAPMTVVLHRHRSAKRTAAQVDRLLTQTPTDADGEWTRELVVSGERMDKSQQEMAKHPFYAQDSRLKVMDALVWADALPAIGEAGAPTAELGSAVATVESLPQPGPKDAQARPVADLDGEADDATALRSNPPPADGVASTAPSPEAANSGTSAGQNAIADAPASAATGSASSDSTAAPGGAANNAAGSTAVSNPGDDTEPQVAGNAAESVANVDVTSGGAREEAAVADATSASSSAQAESARSGQAIKRGKKGKPAATGAKPTKPKTASKPSGGLLLALSPKLAAGHAKVTAKIAKVAELRAAKAKHELALDAEGLTQAEEQTHDAAVARLETELEAAEEAITLARERFVVSVKAQAVKVPLARRKTFGAALVNLKAAVDAAQEANSAAQARYALAGVGAVGGAKDLLIQCAEASASEYIYRKTGVSTSLSNLKVELTLEDNTVGVKLAGLTPEQLGSVSMSELGEAALKGTQEYADILWSFDTEAENTATRLAYQGDVLAAILDGFETNAGWKRPSAVSFSGSRPSKARVAGRVGGRVNVQGSADMKAQMDAKMKAEIKSMPPEEQARMKALMPHLFDDKQEPAPAAPEAQPAQ